MINKFNMSGKICIIILIGMIAMIITGSVFIHQSKTIKDPNDSDDKNKNGISMIVIGILVGIASLVILSLPISTKNPRIHTYRMN
jgi:hypothetical protein